MTIQPTPTNPWDRPLVAPRKAADIQTGLNPTQVASL